MYTNFPGRIILCILFFLPNHLFAQSPGGIAKPSIWLQGNFSEDGSRSRLLNFNPAMTLDEIKTSIALPGRIAPLRRSTIFTVYQHPAAKEEAMVWEMSGSLGDLLLSTRNVSSKGMKTIISFAKKAGNIQRAEPLIHTYISSQAKSIASNNMEDNGSAIAFGSTISANGSEGSGGLISEFILYERILSDAEINKTESYLALKYGITLEKNYVNSSGHIIWNWKEDKIYSNNIAGIGRDDRSGLYQKQGTSSHSAGQPVIGINQIAPTNIKNTGSCSNMDYLVWGDNAQNFMFSESKTGTGEMLCEKKWLMKLSGYTSNTISTTLQIDIKKLLPWNFKKENLHLIIERSGPGDFAPANCTYLMPDSISEDGIATFNGILWDTDRSGQDKFTFGYNSSELRQLHENNTDVNVRSFQVYPNPVTDGHYKAAITLNKPSQIQVQVYDLYGHLIESRKETGKSYYLLSGTITGAAGPYTIRLITSNEEFIRVIILQ